MCVCARTLSRVQSLVVLWTVTCQAPLSMELFRREYWSRLPSPPPRELCDPGIEPSSPASLILAGVFLITEAPGKPIGTCSKKIIKSSIWIWAFKFISVSPKHFVTTPLYPFWTEESVKLNNFSILFSKVIKFKSAKESWEASEICQMDPHSPYESN